MCIYLPSCAIQNWYSPEYWVAWGSAAVFTANVLSKPVLYPVLSGQWLSSIHYGLPFHCVGRVDTCNHWPLVISSLPVNTLMLVVCVCTRSRNGCNVACVIGVEYADRGVIKQVPYMLIDLVLWSLELSKKLLLWWPQMSTSSALYHIVWMSSVSEKPCRALTALHVVHAKQFCSVFSSLFLLASPEYNNEAAMLDVTESLVHTQVLDMR
jgi:hypothetical protein